MNVCALQYSSRVEKLFKNTLNLKISTLNAVSFESMRQFLTFVTFFYFLPFIDMIQVGMNLARTASLSKKTLPTLYKVLQSSLQKPTGQGLTLSSKTNEQHFWKSKLHSGALSNITILDMQFLV